MRRVSTVSLPPDRKAMEARAKVFRHKLQQQQQRQLQRLHSIESESSVNSDGDPHRSMLLYTYGNPPVSLPSTGYNRRSHSSLPPDYRAPVATLPPIPSLRSGTFSQDNFFEEDPEEGDCVTPRGIDVDSLALSAADRHHSMSPIQPPEEGATVNSNVFRQPLA